MVDQTGRGHMKKHSRSLVGLLKEHFGLLKPIRGVEVGVWRGELSSDLLGSFPRLTLWMVDPWEKLLEGTPTMPKRIEEVKAAREEARKSTQFNKRVICVSTSLLAAAEFAESGIMFHFAFIDACHLYESVRDDVAAWWSLILPNGILCGHDYNGVGDRRCGWGVKRAVDEKFGAAKVNTLPGNVWFVVK